MKTRLEAVARQDDARVRHVFVRALRGMPLTWFVLAGAFAASPDLPFSSAHTQVVQRALIVLFVGSLTLFAARVASGFVANWAGRTLSGTTSILSNIAVLAIWAVGGLVVLETLGISITPVLTALGVGGLAVALALKETLSNLFAGIQVLASRQVRIGDYVRLESGEEGYVTDIQWRSTSIRSLRNNVIVVPNAKLAESIVTNYHRPGKQLALQLPICVAYGTDLERVEVIAAEVGRELMSEVAGGVPEFAPFVRCSTLGDSGIGLTWVLRAREFADQPLLTHEALKRLLARFQAEGIEIPYPTRSVLVTPSPPEQPTSLSAAV